MRSAPFLNSNRDGDFSDEILFLMSGFCFDRCCLVVPQRYNSIRRPLESVINQDHQQLVCVKLFFERVCVFRSFFFSFSNARNDQNKVDPDFGGD